MKLKSIILSFTFCTTIVSSNIVIINNVFVQHNKINVFVKQNINWSNSNIDQFMYSGEILGYFIYKSSDISTNPIVKKLEQNIIKNKNIIYSSSANTDGVNMQNKNVFETALIASIVNISIYGMTSWSEFFAEAYSKWTTTPNEMKNKSWEILNNFFTIIYPELHKNYFGKRQNTWLNILNFMDNFLTTNSVVVYQTTLTMKPTVVVDLKYDGLFGFQQIIPNNMAIESNNYTFNALKSALVKWQNSSYDSINRFSHNLINQYVINYDNNNLSNDLAIMMNDSYTKASVKSVNRYNELLNSLQKEYYSSFQTLSQSLKEHTDLVQESKANSSTIMLKDSIDAMAKYYDWTNNKIITFEEQILNLFNLTNYVTDKNFKYYLRSFIFTPDYPIQGQPEQTMAVTATAGQAIRNETFQYFLAVEFATVLFTGVAFNQEREGGIILIKIIKLVDEVRQTPLQH
ncbi:hypothetical protein S100390_v1c04840 [Spiroplasma sp. NBRC 100390]|uniref:hypothetical protein n=1 Tax=unclassified Spiroplasma TaxID=2637901 RepID=UPI0008929A63|nr:MULTISPECIES: hypothetical protein [unclassified Spiroplasma]AOX43827.1 hypothetical protein STU14_v1c04840 [Spiroplasma sp. TU-14]APE13297.1 hypothetical protein S100390_v1c04840 [Spiroplasma sp. NBRC 100390]